MRESDILYGKNPKDLNELKEIKIKLPLRFHIKLHSLKLLKKQTISDSVIAALDDYFTKAGPDATAEGAVEALMRSEAANRLD